MKKTKEVNKIFRTKDYCMFKFIEGNRRVNQRNYAKLINSMKEEQLQIPIIVNENYEIVDGQHRFLASKELKLPVFYTMIKGYTIKQVRRANMVGSNWIKEDFLNMHKLDGIEAYTVFSDMMELYDTNISDLLKVFAIVQERTQSLISKDFEEGTFTIKGLEKVTEFLDALEDFSFFTSFKSRAFFGAFLRLYFQSNYEHDKMIDRIRKRKGAFKKRSTIDEYLLILTKDVYSFGAIKNPIFYDVESKRFYEPI